MGYSPPDYSYMKIFTGFFFAIAVEDSVVGFLYNLHQFPLVFNTNIIYSLNMTFSHHIFCCFIICYHFNCFVDRNSQLDRFLT